jgi:PPOX class probable F420-dependent enzyme
MKATVLMTWSTTTAIRRICTMSSLPLTDDAKTMLSKPNPSVISTIRSDGQPVTAATWYLLRDERILVNMDEGRKRLAHMRDDPRVSLTVIDDADFYTHITVIGRVIRIYDDDGLADIDALSEHYQGRPYPQRDRPRVSALIDIDRVHGWGAQKNNDQADGRG